MLANILEKEIIYLLSMLLIIILMFSNVLEKEVMLEEKDMLKNIILKLVFLLSLNWVLLALIYQQPVCSSRNNIYEIIILSV
jgi:hypothetical protein